MVNDIIYYDRYKMYRGYRYFSFYRYFTELRAPNLEYTYAGREIRFVSNIFDLPNYRDMITEDLDV